MNSSMNGADKQTVESEFLYTLDKFRQTNFFFNLAPEAVKLISFMCTKEDFQEGDVLFHQNDDDGTAYYLLEGKANLIRHSGDEHVTVKTYGPDEFIGGFSLVAPMPRQFSLVAAEELVCLVITRAKFSRVLEQFPDITAKILAALGEKILEAEKSMIHDLEIRKKDIKNLLGISLI